MYLAIAPDILVWSSAVRGVITGPLMVSADEEWELPESEAESERRSSLSVVKEFVRYWVASLIASARTSTTALGRAPPQRPGSDGRGGDLAGEDRSTRRTPRVLLGLRMRRDWDLPVYDGSSAERGELRLHPGSRARRPWPPPASPPARGGEKRRDAASSESGSLSC
ncbi:hypothetical protein NDU88_007819 [Pleurodeles waltl]|uniref:Uncharacterized protein n=1 Tax=Pleurodeles waltl TaxID=8319 RepID=A0AAV7U0S9_PLEWA|nr:hypothetical protein NDU88_007819 [Pleurodeles waltl]